MNTQQESDYNRIATAIAYIGKNFKTQPGLNELAEQLSLSPFHFQRLFSDWAGVSPKKFLQYITVGYAKRMLREEAVTLFDTAIESGLSGTGRLHDLFINIEGMSPGEYKNGGESLTINYDFADSPFGRLLVAATNKGICHLAFCEEDAVAIDTMVARYPAAIYRQQSDSLQRDALSIFNKDWSSLNKIRLHLKGTPFQLKVWETLLSIPLGKLTTYGKVAQKINQPNASRAVGTAIGDNPVAFLIPCHRIIQSTGMVGGYHWGAVRKTAMIAWEAAQTNVPDLT